MLLLLQMGRVRCGGLWISVAVFCCVTTPVLLLLMLLMMLLMISLLLLQMGRARRGGLCRTSTKAVGAF